MKLIDTIETFISGDWGNETLTEETPCEVYCVRGADIEPIKNQDYNHIPIRYISKRSYENKLLQAGDIIVEKSGGSPTQSTGRVCLITPDLVEKLHSVDCSNFCTAFRVKKEWDAEYIYLYIQHIYNMGAFFNFEGKTSGIKNLQLEQAYQAIEIKPIPLAEQKKLAKVIRTMDSKMAINRAINQNLDAMAKQLYDYWFMQFDFPNEEGKPYRANGGKMVWNEKLKREIPECWESATIESFLIIKNGKDHKHLEDGDYPVYGSGGLMRKVSQKLYEGESVLMPRKGTLNNIMYVNEAFWTVDTMFYSQMRIQQCAKYVYYAIKDYDFTRWDSGTGVPSMTSSTLYALAVVKPDEKVLKLFDERISPLFAAIKQHKTEIENLIRQRDELLPLLMNGQVSVTQLNSDLSQS